MSNIADFEENHAKLKGFNGFYNDKIGPYLESRESERKAKAAKAIKVGVIIACLGLTIGIAIFVKTGSKLGLVIPTGIGAFICIACVHVMTNGIRDQIKEFVMTNICEFIGWTFTHKNFDVPNISGWRDNKLLPNRYDRIDFEDQMSGVENGADFSFCECHMEQERTDSDGDSTWTTVFRGILLTIDFHREFLGRTVVLRDGGIFNRKKKSGMKRVGLVDPVFEKKFEAYSTDQVEARYLLTPVFMQTLVDLEESVSGKKIRFGFFDDKLHIAIEAPNQFEIGSMFKTLLDVERTKKILKEINAILNVIESVSKTKKRR